MESQAGLPISIALSHAGLPATSIGPSIACLLSPLAQLWPNWMHLRTEVCWTEGHPDHARLFAPTFSLPFAPGCWSERIINKHLPWFQGAGQRISTVDPGTMLISTGPASPGREEARQAK